MLSGPAHSTSHGKHLFLIDGYGFLFRAYHAMPPLTRPDGTPVGAISGFCNMLFKLRQRIEESNRVNPEEHYMAVVLDSGRKSFRNDIYPEYKANRPPAPDDLIPQFPLVRDAVNALHVPVIEKEGFEADDLIATYTRLAQKAGAKITIVSSDKDLMQLVSDDVSLYDAMKDKEIREKEVIEKFGVPPNQVLDALALMGDSSDNIPGVPGIGPKTAAELLQQFGSLEGVLSHTADIKQNKRRETLEQNADKARLSKQLAALCETAPTETPLEALVLKPLDIPAITAFLTAQNFKALLSRIEKGTPVKTAAASPITPPVVAAPTIAPTARVPEVAVRPLASAQDFSTLNSSVALHGTVSIIMLGNTLLLAAEPHEAWLLKEGSGANQHDLFSAAAPTTSLAPLKSLLENPSVLKIGHDIKRLVKWALDENIVVRAFDDIMLMSYVLDGTQHDHSVALLAEQQLGITLPTLEEKKPEAGVLHQQAATHAVLCLRLHGALKKRLATENMAQVYETLERPLIAVLAGMEHRGITVDVAELANISRSLEATMKEEEKKIFAAAGREFNIGSPKQLGEVLFDEMGIPGGKKSKKSGTYGTGADVLEELAAKGFFIATNVLSWRQVSKLKNTYTDALPQEVNQKTGRIHTSFMMTVTNTGRLSSQAPNLQNIPVRSEEGKLIRRAFIAPKGRQLISADYSQIELRLLADIADIKPLKEAFMEGIDIHAKTAAQVFGVALKDVTPDMRRGAKAINFGIIYGQSAFGLAQGLGIGRGEAQQYIEAYFREYPGIRAFMEETKRFAREHGYVTTRFGRKCFLPGIMNKNQAIRNFSERAAINAPLQGTAADIIKLAMIKLVSTLAEQCPEAQLLLQIHDELLLEVPEAHSAHACTLVKTVMEKAASLSVPLTADVHAGRNWGEIH